MNRLDRAIAYVAPVFAARRATARARMRAIEIAMAYYDGADLGRRGASIRRSGAAADAISARSLPALRSGSHDLVRNNPHARRGLETIVSNTVGAGIIPRFKRQRKAVQELEELARETLDTTEIDAQGQLDYYGQTALLWNTVVESGEALVIRQWRSTGFPMQFLVLEPDYLDSARDGDLPDGGRIIQGVEYDRNGRRRRYWLYSEHPGSGYMRRVKSIPVEARDVAHVYRVDRPGQVRGIPWLAPVMLRVADFDDYENAQLMRQKIAACFAAFYIDTTGAAATTPTDLKERIEPGMIQRLGAGSDVKFGNPPQVTDYKDYAKVSLRAIAAGLGISYEALTGDLEGVNFTSGRMGWLEFQRNIDRWRWLTLIPQGCAPMMRWWLEGASMLGYDTTGVLVQHSPPKREMISPEREVPAMERALQSGQRTLAQHVQESGRDLDEHLDEIAEVADMLDARGLSLPGLPSRAAAPPDLDDDPDDDPNPDDDPDDEDEDES